MYKFCFIVVLKVKYYNGNLMGYSIVIVNNFEVYIESGSVEWLSVFYECLSLMLL